MCGRFSLTREEAEIEKRFQARFYTNDLVKRYNVAPSQLALVMTGDEPHVLQLYKWGLVPSWSVEITNAYKMINAKAETLFEKPSFKNLIKSRRCIIVSDGFYEWKLLDGKNKQPFRIGLKEDELFAFGGLWDSRVDKSTGEILFTFTIITTEANELVKPVHDRMPLILEREDELKWLDKNTDIETIKQLLRPFDAGKMKLYPVSKLVNSPSNDTIEIIQPITID